MEGTTFERVHGVLATQFGVAALPESTLAGDLGFDSLDEVEFIMFVEDEVGLAEIADDDVLACKTVGDVVALVDRYVAEGRAA